MVAGPTRWAHAQPQPLAHVACSANQRCWCVAWPPWPHAGHSASGPHTIVRHTVHTAAGVWHAVHRPPVSARRHALHSAAKKADDGARNGREGEGACAVVSHGARPPYPDRGAAVRACASAAHTVSASGTASRASHAQQLGTCVQKIPSQQQVCVRRTRAPVARPVLVVQQASAARRELVRPQGREHHQERDRLNITPLEVERKARVAHLPQTRVGRRRRGQRTHPATSTEARARFIQRTQHRLAERMGRPCRLARQGGVRREDGCRQQPCLRGHGSPRAPAAREGQGERLLHAPARFVATRSAYLDQRRVTAGSRGCGVVPARCRRWQVKKAGPCVCLPPLATVTDDRAPLVRVPARVHRHGHARAPARPPARSGPPAMRRTDTARPGLHCMAADPPP